MSKNLASKATSKNYYKIANLLNKNEDVTLEMQEIFNKVTQKKLDKKNPLKTVSYFTRLKRKGLQKLQKEFTSELINNYLNDFLALAEEYLNSDNNEIKQIVTEIRQDVDLIVEKIENNKFINLLEVSSSLDVTVLKAVTADAIFNEITESYMFLTDSQEVTLNSEQEKVANNMYFECKNKNIKINSEIDYQLNKPNQVLTKKIGEPIDLLNKQKLNVAMKK